MKLVTGHERLVTGHDKKLNFSKTGHQTSQLVTKPAGHDQTGHKSHKTRHSEKKKKIIQKKYFS
jgi:hypothetical protein